MKKVFSLLLAAALMLGSVPAIAADEYEKAVKTVKYYFDLTDYDKFNYSVRNTDEGKLYSLSWSNAENSDSVYAVTDMDGRIYSYSHYKDNEGGSKETDKDKAMLMAQSFVEKMYGKAAAEEYEVIAAESYGQGCTVSLQQYHNGIPVEFNTIAITLDNDMEITEFSANPANMDIALPKGEASLDEKKAKQAYLDNIGLELKYYSGYDKNKSTVYAAYTPDYGDSYIDAYTGKSFTPYYSSVYPIADRMAAAELASDASGATNSIDEVQLTETEKAEIDKLTNAISPTKAVNAVNSAFGTDYTLAKVKESYRKSKDGQYIIYINNDDFSASVKNDGTILSYNYNTDYDNNKKNKFDGKALSKALVDKLAPRLDYRYNEDRDSQNSFIYKRYVNGIESTMESISFYYNNEGKLISYRRSDSVYTYPDISKAITPQAAFDRAKEAVGYTLKYTMSAAKDKATLAYSFDDGFRINSEGKLVDYSGEEIAPEVKQYTDIDGIWCEKAADYLFDRGYRFEGKEFMYDKALTQLDFFKLMSGSSSEDDAYEYAEQALNYKGKRENDHIVTRYELAKYICCIMGYGNLGAKDIFKPAFDDVSAQYIGYTAICSTYGIMGADSGKHFNGEKEVNRGQMAQALYNSFMAEK